MGRLSGIDTTLGTTAIQDNGYAWRSDGSLATRTAGAAGSRGDREEEFAYDHLNRLTGAETYLSDGSTASRTLTFDYDLRGNLETKTSDVEAAGGVEGDVDVADYDHPTTSNRLESATVGDVAYEFSHDTSGHVTTYDAATGDDRFVPWNARGLAARIVLGPAGAYERTARSGGAAVERLRIGGSVVHVGTTTAGRRWRRRSSTCTGTTRARWRR